MNPHIEYLKQLKAHGQNVVAIDYVVELLSGIDGNASQTAVKVPQRRFDRQEHQHIIQTGWRSYEDSRRSRAYHDMEEER